MQHTQALPVSSIETAKTQSGESHLRGVNYSSPSGDIQPHLSRNIVGKLDHLSTERFATLRQEKLGEEKSWQNRSLRDLRDMASGHASSTLNRKLCELKVGKEETFRLNQTVELGLGMTMASGSARGYPNGRVEGLHSEHEGHVDVSNDGLVGVETDYGAPSDQNVNNDATAGQWASTGYAAAEGPAMETSGRGECAGRSTCHSMELNHVGNVGDVELNGQIRQALCDSVKSVQGESPRINGLDRSNENVGGSLDLSEPSQRWAFDDGVNHSMAAETLYAKSSQLTSGRLVKRISDAGKFAADVSMVGQEEGMMDDMIETVVEESAMDANLLKNGEDVAADLPETVTWGDEIEETCFLDQIWNNTRGNCKREVPATDPEAPDGRTTVCTVADEVRKSRIPQIGSTDERIVNDSSSDCVNGTQPEKSSASELTPECDKSGLPAPRLLESGLTILENGTRCMDEPASSSKRVPPLLQAHSRTDEAVETIKDEYDACTIPLAGMGRQAIREREARGRERNEAGNPIRSNKPKGKLTSMFDSDDDDFEELKTSKGRSVSKKRSSAERAPKSDLKALGEKKVKPSRSTLKSMFEDEEIVDVQPALKKPKISRKTPKERVNSTPRKIKQRRKESVFDDKKPSQAIGRGKEGGLPDSSDDETDEDFIPCNVSKARGSQAQKRSSSRNEKVSARTSDENTLPSEMQSCDTEPALFSKKGASSRSRGRAKDTKTIDLTVGSPMKKASVAGEEGIDDATSPSQGGSQPLDIVVEPIKERRKRGRRFADYLYRKLTEDDASLIRQAFIKYYRTPPSNGTMQGCYELKHGREMSEALKKELWETKLKPWSDRWWELYQKFGEVGREIKRRKEKKDVKPALNMRELTTAAKKFYEEHGNAQPPGQNGSNASIVKMLSLD